MPFTVSITSTTVDGNLVLASVNPSSFTEDIPGYRRFVPFGMVINSAFTSSNDTSPLAFSDEATPYTNSYPLVDNLNKNVTGDQLFAYAGMNRCIRCVFDNLYKVVRVYSWLAPATLTVPTADSTTDTTT